MQNHLFNAIFLIASYSLSTGAWSENTYKCGNSYSQLPCPGGTVIDTDDQRSSAQKTQTDLATRRDAKAAEAMAKARLQQEKEDLAANTPRPNPASVKSSTNATASRSGSTLHAHKKESKPFTALVPGEKKTPAAVKKKSKTKTDKA